MTHFEFSPHIDSLRETYGDRAYPDARVERIWLWAKKLKPETFKQIVDAAISDCDRPPLLSKLKEIHSEIRSRDPSADKINCPFCDGCGFICDEQPLPTAYACRCEAGQQIPEKYARWKGPWKRIVPHPNEIMRVSVKDAINNAFGGKQE